ncbi:MAG: bifunctional metallophosphatase/5'-nucleotidase [Candidatus Latescibacteria bacterium]|nr:bifunctional metallophosphatase/5'-nucleotidase [Candidatus Latescibacterota bacterium]
MVFFIGFLALEVVSCFLTPTEAIAQSIPASSFQDTLTLTIFHSNDVNGVLDRQRSRAGFTGGMAPRAQIMEHARANGPVLAFDAGNALGPAPLSTWDQGASMIDAMQFAGYTAMLPSNHEFDYGIDVLRRHNVRSRIPFLGTNLSYSDGGDLFTKSLLIDVEGAQVGIIGLLSPAIVTLTNPRNFGGIDILEPIRAATEEISRLEVAGADYIIVLTNMQEDETLNLARQAKGVHLVIAGGYRNVGRAEMLPGLIRLVNGTQIVTTPGAGSLLGEVTARLVRRADGSYKHLRSSAALRTIDKTVRDHRQVATVVENAVERYVTAAGDTLGTIAGGTHYDQTHMVADMIRDYTDAEVGILNFGVIQPLATDQALIRRDISRFIRFPNTIQLINLSGSQLRSIAAQSSRSTRNSARLAFSGLDATTMRVEGRQLIESEDYLVSITDFLANGGDGYTQFVDSPVQMELGKPLRTLLQETLLERGRLDAHGLDRIRRRGVWHSGLQLEGAFERNYVDRTTEELRSQNEQVPFLSGATTVAWSGALRYFLERQSGPHLMRYQQRMEFSQIGRSFDDLTPSKDQVELEARYRYRTSGNRGDPFVSMGLNTAFTNGASQRPVQQVSTVGFEYQLSQNLIARVAGRSQRDFVANKTDLGGELTMEWRRALPSKVDLQSRVRSFFGVTNRRVISVENYNTISLPLLGDLRLNVRQNNFLYRVNQIGGVATNGVAFRSILTLGFAYGLNWKWL